MSANDRRRPLMLVAGGTGGHIFPAVALARELTARGERPVVITDRRGLRYLPDHLEHRRILAASPTGSIGRRLGGALLLVLGTLQSVWLCLRHRPAAVAVFGGYASVPFGLTARLLGTPVLIHEQNAVLGRANRLLARVGMGDYRLAISLPETRGASTEAKLTGNPVRSDVLALAAKAYVPPSPDETFRLLVVGGSQGARALSDAVPAAIRTLSPELRARLQLVQQCRPEDLDRVAAVYRELGFAAELKPFFADLPTRMAEAHLVISRSGASSVAELLVLGRPSILVPYRFAAEDHQRANAAAVASAKAAQILEEQGLTGDVLAATLREMMEHPETLATMAQNARSLGRSEAVHDLADHLLALAPARATARSRELPA